MCKQCVPGPLSALWEGPGYKVSTAQYTPLTGPVVAHCACAVHVGYTHVLVLMASYSTQNQQTALHMAIRRSHHETVQLLLERGADPNRQDRVRVVYI